MAACSAPEERPSVPAGAQAGDLILSPCTYEAREVEYEADCGTLVVPEVRDKPGSRLIALTVTRVRAKSDNPGEPIFFLAGGPGASNAYFSRVAGLIDKHDVVLVGYRGVDGSVALDCPEVREVLGSGSAGLLSREAMGHMAEAYSACGRRLQGEGVDTDGYTVTEVIDDLEQARASMGYERINLLSQSYGTRLAMLYAWIYPERIHRSAMISVNPPGHFVWFPEIIDEQLHYYAGLCAKDAACSTRTDDLAESMRRVATDLPERWLFFPIKRDNVMMGTFMMLYHTDTAAQVFDAWLAADEGDPAGLALMSVMIDLMLPKLSFLGESAAKATSVDYEYDPDRDYYAEMNPPGAILGAQASLLGYSAAAGWPVKRVPEELQRVQPSDVSTLLVSGSIDFSTPAQTATEKLLPHLSNGRQVILSEFGHTGDVWYLQPEATVRLLTSFFDTGQADDSQYTYQPMSFAVDWGFAAKAKLALAIPLALLVILAGALWFVVRGVRRRRRSIPINPA
jgi:pimeloyl-ACP methyl ester carboxylesterase